MDAITVANPVVKTHIGALVGYARVSSIDQDNALQIERLQAAGCTRLFAEKASGTKRDGRTQLEECLLWMRDGDTLVITRIDRLARSARDLHNLVHDLEQRGIALMVLDQTIDTRTPHGKAFLGMLATFAEFETNIRKERQLEGIAKAKREGVYKGRKPTARAKLAQIQALLSEGHSRPQIAKTLGISNTSVYTLLKECAA